MNIKIIKPEKLIFDGDIQLVQFPGVDGSFEVLNSHAPMVALIKDGRIRVVNLEGDTLYFDVNGGVMEVSENQIMVLVE